MYVCVFVNLKEINAFIQQGFIKLIKSINKDVKIVRKYKFQINAVLLNF